MFQNSLKTVQLSKGDYPSAPIQWLCPCVPFVVVPFTQFEVEYHQVFSHCFVLIKTWQRWQKMRASLFGHDDETTVPV